MNADDKRVRRGPERLRRMLVVYPPFREASFPLYLKLVALLAMVFAILAAGWIVASVAVEVMRFYFQQGS